MPVSLPHLHVVATLPGTVLGVWRHPRLRPLDEREQTLSMKTSNYKAYEKVMAAKEKRVEWDQWEGAAKLSDYAWLPSAAVIKYADKAP